MPLPPPQRSPDLPPLWKFWGRYGYPHAVPERSAGTQSGSHLWPTSNFNARRLKTLVLYGLRRLGGFGGFFEKVFTTTGGRATRSHRGKFQGNNRSFTAGGSHSRYVPEESICGRYYRSGWVSFPFFAHSIIRSTCLWAPFCLWRSKKNIFTAWPLTAFDSIQHAICNKSWKFLRSKCLRRIMNIHISDIYALWLFTFWGKKSGGTT